MLKYKCLVLDHDDTLVKTTPQIHFPSFKETIAAVRPNLQITLEEFLIHCFEPGFYVYMEKILGFTPKEMEYQLSCWLNYVRNHVPESYVGMREIILNHKKCGGIVTVVSHSYKEIILRDYAIHVGVVPDAVYGGDEPENRRKPAVFPLLDISRKFSISPKEMVVIDDLKPGLDMANSFGANFICAGWSHSISKIAEFMKRECKNYASSVGELKELLFN